MKVMMILPPLITVPGMALSFLDSGHKYSVFVDTQASLVNLKMHRYLVEHQIPGREGGKLQDLGSACSVITLQGKWIYENRPREDILNAIPALSLIAGNKVGWNWIRLQMFQLLYRFKEPLILASDLITTMVLIEDYDFTYEGGKPNVYGYTMVLKEVDPRLTLIGMAGSAIAKSLNIIPQEGVGL